MDLMTQLKGSFGIITNPDVITYLLRGVAFTALWSALSSVFCATIAGMVWSVS